MKYLSICSGIEAASVAFKPLGWEPVAFSEIESFPSAVLAHHYPAVPNLGDMTKFREWPEEIFRDADVIVGGTPCQAFSVAGRRGSLDDERGNLTLTFSHIIDHATNIRTTYGKPKPIFMWENVPGVLNTKDNAFGCFLGEISGAGCALVGPGGKWSSAGAVSGPKRNVAWRILDAQFFGVAQRRRRVFVVGCPTEGPCPTEILFEREGVQRHSPPSRAKREEVAAPAGFRLEAFGKYTNDGTASTMKRRDYKDATDLVAFDTTQLTSPKNYSNPQPGDPCHPLAAGAHVPAVANISHWDGGPHPTLGQSASATGSPGYSNQEIFSQQGGGLVPANVGTVRRLTPVECARLQGFPDDYLDIEVNGKPAPDTAKYKALGNSWAVPCAAWIGRRIARAAQLQQAA